MLAVAIDAGPLHGPRTGVGNAVAWTFDALRNLDGTGDNRASIELIPYVTSMRARLAPGERRLPLPAAVAHRMWARTSAVRMDRWLDRPDVVHGTNYVVPPTRAPRLVSVYDCWFLEHPADAHPDVRRAAAVLQRSVDDGADVVTSSSASTDRVRDLLATDRVHTVHLGPPPTAGRMCRPAAWPAKWPDDSDDPFVLALGTIERRKNIAVLIRAFDRLAQEHDSARLVIAGAPGDDSAAVAATLDRLVDGVGARTAVLGPVTAQEKTWLLHNAAVLAYPSLDEGFGFPILEAQAAGTAVVGSCAGSIPEVAGAAALLSLPTDAQALAANLFWALTDDTKRNTLVEAGRRNLERFSWRRTATELATLYRDLAEQAST